MEYQIWMEGHRASGEHSNAVLLSVVHASSFDEAVYTYITTIAEKAVMGLYIKTQKFDQRDLTGKMPMVTAHSIWGRWLFDNEADARKSFG